MRFVASFGAILGVLLFLAAFGHPPSVVAGLTKAAEVKRGIEALRRASAGDDQWEVERTPDGGVSVLRGGSTAVGGGLPRYVALDFVRQHAAALGIAADVVPRLLVTEEAPSADGTRVVLTQTAQGLPVLNGDVEVHVSADGTVFRVNVQNQIRVTQVAAPQRTALQAANAAATQAASTAEDKLGRRIALRGGGLLRHSSLGVWAKDSGPRLAHELVLEYSEAGVVLQQVVDDASGAVLDTAPLSVSVDGRGRFFDPNPLNFAPGDATISETNLDGRFLTRSVLGTLPGLIANGSGQYSLSGPYVTMVELETPVVANPVETLPANFDYDWKDVRFDAVTAYKVLDEATRRLHGLGFENVMNVPLRVDPHGLDGAENAHYVSSPRGRGFITFGDGGVNDAQDGDVVLHEMGHAIQDWQTSRKYMHDGESGAMGEGFGDFWAASMTYEKSLAAGFDPAAFAEWDATAYSTRNPPSMRRLDSTKVYPTDIVNRVHSDGMIWSAALYAVFTSVPAARRDDVLRIVLHSHSLVPDDPTFRQGAQALLDANQVLLTAVRPVADHRRLIRDKMKLRGILRNAAPTDLSGSFSLGAGNALVWADNSDVETAYEVLRSQAGEAAPIFAVYATLPPNSTTYADVQVTAANSYQYRIRAVDPDAANVADSPTSAAASVTSGEPPRVETPASTPAATEPAPSGGGSAPGGASGGAGGGAGGGGGGGGGCFIATAAYGTPSETHVIALRGFRDHVLLHSQAGRAFVAFYYRWSPPIAEMVRERPWARAAVRAGLAPLVLAVEQPALLGMLLLLTGVLVVRQRRSWGRRSA